jgi:hypothetical protein
MTAPKLLKKFFFFNEYAAENMIGGRRILKNKSSFNLFKSVELNNNLPIAPITNPTRIPTEDSCKSGFFKCSR